LVGATVDQQEQIEGLRGQAFLLSGGGLVGEMVIEKNNSWERGAFWRPHQLSARCKRVHLAVGSSNFDDDYFL
jgi:hypothetical protein